MPQWAHLPLILKPDGHGKLSKRDGDRLGFPVFATNWLDQKTGDFTPGFRELGFLPEAFLNLLAMLGWNDGTDQEIFSLDELIEKFSIERVSHAGAKFDYEKAKWYNAEWIKRIDVENLKKLILEQLQLENINLSDDVYLSRVIELVKDRLVLLKDFWEQASFFFQRPEQYDEAAVKPKWSAEKASFYQNLNKKMEVLTHWESALLEETFKAEAEAAGMKVGELMLPLRVMLVGGKFGPGVFDIAALLGKAETIERIRKASEVFSE